MRVVVVVGDGFDDIIKMAKSLREQRLAYHNLQDKGASWTMRSISYCSVEGCEIRCKSQGLCNKHYCRKRYHGTTNSLHKLWCQVEGCGLRIRSNGYCGKHLYRWQTFGDPLFTPILRGEGTNHEERFWSRVNIGDIEECWEWKGRLRKNGYGRIKVEKVFWYTHRYAWYVTYGIRPEMLICHTCDNPSCVNPHHLFEGTHQDNTTDMIQKKRAFWQRGEVSQL